MKILARKHIQNLKEALLYISILVDARIHSSEKLLRDDRRWMKDDKEYIEWLEADRRANFEHLRRIRDIAERLRYKL